MADMNGFAQETTTSLRTGTMLKGRYRIEKPIGQGGFGITYSALDTKTYNRIAVKELFPSRYVLREEDRKTVRIQPGQESNFRHLSDSFEKEAKTLMGLQNLEGVVRLLHVFDENNTVYYIMELLQGEDLMHRLKREGPMKWDHLAPILGMILTALDQIHSVGLIHRDISPDNIFLTDRGARLIDFGSVRNYQDGLHFTAMVKRNFAPIEQFLDNGHQGPWTDVYALAVTAYYALTGQLPPPALERVNEDKLVPLDVLCPGLPREICAAIHRAMTVQPEGRFQTTKQFSRALMLRQATMDMELHGSGITCLRGGFLGRHWNIRPDSALTIGRNPDCVISYPRTYPGVSRTQCTIYRTAEGKYMVKDDNSSYGTTLKTDTKEVIMKPGVWYYADGAQILFGNEKYVLR